MISQLFNSSNYISGLFSSSKTLYLKIFLVPNLYLINTLNIWHVLTSCRPGEVLEALENGRVMTFKKNSGNILRTFGIFSRFSPDQKQFSSGAETRFIGNS